jgi:hypothetical protein
MNCTVTGKQGFPTRNKAAVGMRTIEGSGNARGGVMSVYLCMACRQWHFGHVAAVTRADHYRTKKKAPRRERQGAEEDDGRWR